MGTHQNKINKSLFIRNERHNHLRSLQMATQLPTQMLRKEIFGLEDE